MTLTREKIEKVRYAAQRAHEGDPLRDFLSDDEIVEALYALSAEGMEAKLMELRRYRCEQDCCYTMGDVADISGKHCPLDHPCEKCKTDAMREAIKRAVDDLDIIIKMHPMTRISGLRDLRVLLSQALNPKNEEKKS